MISVKKFLGILKKVVLGIVLAAYLGVVIAISVLLLAKNDYGITQFGDKVVILMEDDNKNDKYPNGVLAIVQNVKFTSIKAGDELFVYKKNKDDTITPIVATVESTTFDTNSPYITFADGVGDYGEDYIAGQIYKSIPTIGKIISTLENKWIFFLVLIVPCFFILIYEIYLIIVYIKFGDEEEDETVPNQTGNVSANDANKIDELMQQINSLKEQVSQTQGAQPSQPATAPTAQVVETPVTPVVEAVPATPVVETLATPVTPVVPTAQVVETPIAPVTPVVETPVTPMAEAVPATPVVETPVTPVTPVAPTAQVVETPVTPVTPVAPTAPVTNQNMTNNEPEFVVLDDNEN